MIKFFLSIFVSIVLLAACKIQVKEQSINTIDSLKISSVKAERPVKRWGMITGIKENKIAYYKQLHATIWPGVLKQIKQCNIQNYSIYIQKIGDKHFLFSYFEYAGTDFDADMKKMASDTLTQRWWKATDPTQTPLPEAASKQKIWTIMEEVFHTN